MQSTKNWTLPWLAAFIGFPPGGALAVALIGRLDTPLEGFLGGAAAGAVIGAVQTLALRRRLPVSWEWIAATTGGLAAGVGLSVALFGAETTLNATLTRAPITGLIVGIAQWLVLRQHTHRAFWWIPALTLVYVVAWYITSLVIGESLNEGFVIFGASGALVH
ncbi:MAG: hypothetical protein H7Y09_12410, partial [Chitinophagaceae bacterium]|nr:hypothetical protein [Anaerolineae bacterium]